MAQERIIHQHLPYVEAGPHNHASMRAHRRREQEAENLVWEWRTEQVEFYEKRTGYVEDDRFVPYELEAIEEIRAELRGMCP